MSLSSDLYEPRGLEVAERPDERTGRRPMKAIVVASRSVMGNMTLSRKKSMSMPRVVRRARPEASIAVSGKLQQATLFLELPIALEPKSTKRPETISTRQSGT